MFGRIFAWLKNLFSTKYEVSLNIADPVKMDAAQVDTLPCDTEIRDETFVGDIPPTYVTHMSPGDGSTDTDLTSFYFDPEPVKPKRTRKKSTAKKSATKKYTKSPRKKNSNVKKV